jgi:GTP-binding protein
LFGGIQFFTTVNELAKLPESAGEVAFAGRSNAGKSSAINALANRKQLAYVAKMPGRTQHLNFFSVRDAQYLVDLPGYGFAGVPLEVKQHWEALVGGYLAQRSALQGLILIMDIRHPLTPLDQQLMEWFSPSEKPVHILLTKCDKLSRQQATVALREVQEALRKQIGRLSVQLFSSLSKQGVDEAREVVVGFLGIEKPPAKGD